MRYAKIMLGFCPLFLLAACGGGSTSTVPPPKQQERKELLTVSKPGELVAYVKTKVAERARQGLGGSPCAYYPAPGAVTSAGSPATDTRNYSGTTVQEQGVEEDDFIKTDGNLIYTLDRNWQLDTGRFAPRMQVNRHLADGSLTLAGSLSLAAADPSQWVDGLYLAADSKHVAVLGGSAKYGSPVAAGPHVSASVVPNCMTEYKVTVDVINVANPAAMPAPQRVSIDGSLVGSRQIGNVLFVVTQHTPVLAVEALPATATALEREALLAKLSAKDILPGIQINGAAAQPLLAETDCYMQVKNASPGIQLTAVTQFDLASATLDRSSRCFMGGSETLYMGTKSLYLATSQFNYDGKNNPPVFPASFTTDLHKFSLDNPSLEYRGSGQVPGHLGWDSQKKSFRLSEYNGDLRVVTFTGSSGWATAQGNPVPTTPPSPATFTILRENFADLSLQKISSLPNNKYPADLGHAGEQIYAVRFLGNRGYIVTFRQSDPLYVLDLTDPLNPKTAGELKMPGFSDYLFPVGENLLFGVGNDASDTGILGGVKVALFDVTDPANAKQLAAQNFGERGSVSGLTASRHALSQFNVGNQSRIALPMMLVSAANPQLSKGLQRFEIDSVAKTMVVKAMIPGAADTNGYDFYQDRSTQMGDKLYYFSKGQLSAHDW